MKKAILWLAGLFVFLALILNVQSVLAQETNRFGMTERLAIAGIVRGLAGLILSLFNVRKSS
ncbi:MAG TPA: hypothetical protein VFS61_10960 [Anaerolineales bacterium]|nr:hypothetical protein [Anaerolineales bacterium]